ncbi:MAG: hypothetical protein ABFD16_16385 [Thermoguttaceae bacterium]
MTTMTKPVRFALKALWREFKRCSERYPPLYCDLFSPDDYDNFKDSYSGWHEWQSEEGGQQYRFYGNPDGLPEFTSLADSAFLVLSKLGQRKEGDYLSWVSLLHHHAFTTPTSLLRGSTHVDEKAPPRGKIGPYSFQPQFTRLAHSLYLSSMALCEILVDPDKVLWLDEYSQVYEHEAEEEREVGHAADEQPEIDLTPPLLQFSFDGVWCLRTTTETGRFPDAKGFAAYRKLVTQPGVGMKSEELLGLHGAVVASAESAGSPGAELLDLDGEKTVWKEIELLQKEADDTIAQDRLREIQDRQNELFEIVKKAKDRGGNRRTMPIIARTLANRVHSQLRNARTMIRKQMPELAEHLKANTTSQGGLFIYRPGH